MLSDRKRLFLLIGLAAAALALAVVYFAVRGVPASRESGGAAGGHSANPPPSSNSKRENIPERTEVAARRSEAVSIAVQMKPEYLPQLKKAAADPDWKVRHAAVNGVGRLGREGDPQFLIDVLRNPNEQAEVRAAAAERLGEMRHWDAGPAIIDAMEDSSDLLRARAGVALRQIIVVDFGYRANDPADRRDEVIQKIRKLWPWFYERFTKLEKAKG
jgi:HEAT repeat protein